jgi:hypothetical protein
LNDVASAIELVDSPTNAFGSLLAIGTHFGEVKLFDGKGTPIASSETAPRPDVTYIRYSAQSKDNHYR